MSLKWLLVRRITLVATACALVGGFIAVCSVSRTANHQNAELAQSVSRQLNLQLLRIDTMLDLPKRFPDWDLVTSYALQPGQCVQLLARDGSVSRSSCEGIDAVVNPTPSWFIDAYTFLFPGDATVSEPVSYRGTGEGSVVASFTPAAIAGATWQTIAPASGFAILLVALLCIVTYYIIDHALRPTTEILQGIDRLAKGDLGVRLPSFRVAEINRISEVFNALVADLKRASSERAELARRLVDAQEQERRHIARELHDEIAQKLSALSALAACLRIAAQQDATGLAGEAKELEAMASSLMASLRRTLTYLRPQEIDDLGLLPSLEGLVAGHNKDCEGRTRYTIEADGDIEELNSETRAHVYRIIQEALNNAARHANAQHVRVTLNQLLGADGRKVELAITDDGIGSAPSAKLKPFPGSGLIGMRERVLALSGSFNAGPLQGGGFGLHVVFPSQPSGGAA
ncbi:MAG: histidine kinase [Hyphomicrobium sp.]|uniref:sensor histidine kinase n=1 Tax=Hyphomicrobium sp. TaxID=82 RepID=UPI0039E47894